MPFHRTTALLWLAFFIFSSLLEASNSFQIVSSFLGSRKTATTCRAPCARFGVLHSTAKTIPVSPTKEDAETSSSNENRKGSSSLKEIIKRKILKRASKRAPTKTSSRNNDKSKNGPSPLHQEPEPLDAMRARAGVLRTSIMKQQMELQQLEREIVCCDRRYRGGEKGTAVFSASLLEQDDDANSNNENTFSQELDKAANTFRSSTNVLLRKLQRVNQRLGPANKNYETPWDFVMSQSSSAARIVSNLVLKEPSRLLHLRDPHTPTLVPHVPAIVARLDKLEDHVVPILERVLNNRQHLASIEPYLVEILERFDDIEPHLPWILDNIDTLAPYTGLLLKHIDELLLYADSDNYYQQNYGPPNLQQQEEENRYALAEQLLPYLEFYVSRLDVLGPHLPLLRPHVPKLLKHDRIGKLSPHVDRLFSYKTDLGTSANMDVLLFWFGWALKIPGLPRVFFALPFSPRLVTFLANRLPKRFVRGYCWGVSCTIDGDYGEDWNQLEKKTTETTKTKISSFLQGEFMKNFLSFPGVE